MVCQAGIRPGPPLAPAPRPARRQTRCRGIQGLPGYPPLPFARKARNSQRHRPEDQRLHCERRRSVVPGHKVPTPVRRQAKPGAGDRSNPEPGFETTLSSSAQPSTCLAVVTFSMLAVIMPGCLARGLNHIPTAGEMTGFRLTQFGTAGHPKQTRFIPIGEIAYRRVGHSS